MLKDNYKLVHKWEVELVAFNNAVAFCTDLEVYKSVLFCIMLVTILKPKGGKGDERKQGGRDEERGSEQRV